LKSSCNAFYLNPLVINAGGGVKAHIDCSISSYIGKTTIPNIVSVLYVEIPSDLQGGELILQHHQNQVAQIQPKTNTLLYFRGDLTHLVDEVKSLQPRVSLVCEQYKLSETQLQQIPKFDVKSSAIQLA
jgi:predicted 2-oxoglutarate/Fe(II)-dependent dioxygenase YbiX